MLGSNAREDHANGQCSYGVHDQVDEAGSDMFSDKYGWEDNTSPNAKPIHGTFSCKILITKVIITPTLLYTISLEWIQINSRTTKENQLLFLESTYVIKILCNARSDWLKQRALSNLRVALSRHRPICTKKDKNNNK